jgi:hypothetical protein
MSIGSKDQPLFLVRMYCEIRVSSGFSHFGGQLPPVVAGPSSIDVLAEPGSLLGSRRTVLVAEETVLATGYLARLVGVPEHVDEVIVHVVLPHDSTAAPGDETAAMVRRAGAAGLGVART